MGYGKEFYSGLDEILEKASKNNIYNKINIKARVYEPENYDELIDYLVDDGCLRIKNETTNELTAKGKVMLNRKYLIDYQNRVRKLWRDRILQFLAVSVSFSAIGLFFVEALRLFFVDTDWGDYILGFCCCHSS